MSLPSRYDTHSKVGALVNGPSILRVVKLEPTKRFGRATLQVCNSILQDTSPPESPDGPKWRWLVQIPTLVPRAVHGNCFIALVFAKAHSDGANHLVT
ncbi:hypothetical protein Acr_08g0004330 [Actinidia rufa]|uniref:Uncharacterized protein n=1 Tax=Actinidia rufa TaxID=165716 RepID=A0A7J0F2B4_9ERIC|nr:hypothetical protein Acr_08g0004330 [Actinidia rufa]